MTQRRGAALLHLAGILKFLLNNAQHMQGMAILRTCARVHILYIYHTSNARPQATPSFFNVGSGLGMSYTNIERVNLYIIYILCVHAC